MIICRFFNGLPFKEGFAITHFGNYHVFFCRRQMEYVGEFINEYGLRTTVHTAAQLDGEKAAMQACQEHYERIMLNLLTPATKEHLLKWKIS